MTPQEKQALHRKLVAQAEAENEHDPQSVHHWDEWELGKVSMISRLTDARCPGFMPGDVVLVKPGVEPDPDFPGYYCRVAYLPFNHGQGKGGDEYIYADAVEIID